MSAVVLIFYFQDRGVIAVGNRPLIIQNDFTILFETEHPETTIIRDTLNKFAELLKSLEHLYTYRITSLSLWHAAAEDMNAQEVSGIIRQVWGSCFSS